MLPGTEMLLILLLLALSAIPALVILLLHRLVSKSQSIPDGFDPLDELSFDRYRPMLRLLDGADFAFLRNQSGFTPQLETRLRGQRTRVFRAYLRDLRDDFGRISMAAKLLMVNARDDRPDIASALVRSELTFAWALAMVHVRLALYSWGFGTVSAAALLNTFNRLRGEFRTLVPVTAAVAAY
jgi:hypothetical protein